MSSTIFAEAPLFESRAATRTLVSSTTLSFASSFDLTDNLFVAELLLDGCPEVLEFGEELSFIEPLHDQGILVNEDDAEHGPSGSRHPVPDGLGYHGLAPFSYGR